jgi:hypothetical protein
MAEITLEFTGPGRDINDFSFALFEASSLGAGSQKEIPGGATLTMQPMIVRKAEGIPQIITIVLSCAGSVATGVIGNYIYDKMKNHSGEHLKMTINRREVKYNNKGQITKILEEEIKIEKK